MKIANALLCCVIGYALGNLNPAYLLGKRKGYDVRKDGSGNAGASNALILAGKAAFFVTASVDILKAFLACRLCRALFPDLLIAEQLGGTFCILGHMFPAVLHFRGGKGLACLGGVILSWHWKAFLFLLLLAALIAFLTQYICFVAPTISVIFPGLYYYKTSLLYCALVLLIPAAPIILKHVTNFRRIAEGTELRMRYLWDKDGELERAGGS